MGVNHNSQVFATCGKCIEEHGIHQEFVEKYPGETAAIKEWLDE